MSSTINEDGQAVTLAGERVREFDGRQDHGTRGTRRYDDGWDECYGPGYGLTRGTSRRLAAVSYDSESERAPFEGGVTDVSDEDRGSWEEHLEREADELLAADEEAKARRADYDPEVEDEGPQGPETPEEMLHGLIGTLPYARQAEVFEEVFGGSGGWHTTLRP